MPNTDFENAKAATEEMFTKDEQITLDDANVDNNSQVAAEENNNTPGTSSEQEVLEKATETAEIAAQAAAEKNAELQQVLQELETVKQQNAQLQGTVDELSKMKEEQIVEEVLTPPVLDISSLAFADEETIKAAQTKYAQDMAEYNRKAFMKEFAPVIEQANEAKNIKEKNELISDLAKVPELSGIEGMLPQLDRIIANNPALSSPDVSIEDKYITAYAIARGVNSINTPPEEPKELTAEDMMKLYNENPAFQEMVEKQRIEQVKSSQQVPPFSASSGAVNAALNIKETPKTFDEASKRTREMFGMS